MSATILIDSFNVAEKDRVRKKPSALSWLTNDGRLGAYGADASKVVAALRECLANLFRSHLTLLMSGITSEGRQIADVFALVCCKGRMKGP
jgi:hypothetical protein